MKRSRPSKSRASRSDKPKLRARRSLSQNFLIDGEIADRIAAALPIRPGDNVYEIGAGKGFLTERLATRNAEIWAVEKDRRMIGMLRKKFRGEDLVRIIDADVLSLPADAEPPNECWLLGNLPYGIGPAILAWAMDRRPRWRGAVVMLQREVIQRLLADPGDPDRGSVSVWFQARARGQALFNVPPAAFHPPPRVMSTVMWIEFAPQTPGVESVSGVDYILKYAFAQRRKMLENNLRAIPHLASDTLERLRTECPDLMRRRAQELHANDFVRLANVLDISPKPPQPE